jgi:hypothetical protein
MGPPAIEVRNFKSCVADLSADLPNQSIYSIGRSSAVNGNSESYSTSDKDSATSPPDPNTTTDLLGILPKRSMAERLRRVNDFVPDKISNHHEQIVGHDVPKSFNIPTILAQYRLQGERGVTPQHIHRVENISTPNESQQSSFPSTLPSQQQFMQSGNDGNNNMEQIMHGFYTGNTDDGLPSNWSFGSIENSDLPEFSGFDFSLEGQDINCLLNGAGWDSPTF